MGGGSGKVGMFEPFPQGAERFSPVADCCLFSTVDFRQSAAVRRVEKNRVVAEAVRPRRLRRDLSLDDAGGLVEDAAVMGERNVRDEARRARLELSRRELAVDGRELGRVIGAVPA